MAEILVCPTCTQSIHREEWPAHSGTCARPKPRLAVAGYLVRLEHGRIRIVTLGPGPFGAVIVLGTSLVDASFSVEEMGKVLEYLGTQLGEQL